jgi:(p)ppGpp synthase/HD superfamily hydrolase
MPTNRFHEALSYASTLHTDQLRKGTDIPYVAHLLGVASLALYYGGTETQAIAALLHDGIEDIGPQIREPIRTRFGQEVLDIVEACTDAEGGGPGKPPWEERKQAYIDGLRDEPIEARLVVAADKLDNARDILRTLRAIGPDTWKRFKRGREDQLWYYRSVIEALRGEDAGPDVAHGPSLQDLLAELETTVDLIEAEATAPTERATDIEAGRPPSGMLR